MDVCKLALTAIVAAVVTLALGQVKSEWGRWIGIAAGILIALSILSELSNLKVLMEQLKTVMADVNGIYMKLLWKALGITYLCEFAADLCRETGNSLIARQIEICGKVSVLLLGMPILLTLLETIAGYGT